MLLQFAAAHLSAGRIAAGPIIEGLITANGSGDLRERPVAVFDLWSVCLAVIKISMAGCLASTSAVSIPPEACVITSRLVLVAVAGIRGDRSRGLSAQFGLVGAAILAGACSAGSFRRIPSIDLVRIGRAFLQLPWLRDPSAHLPVPPEVSRDV